MKTFKIILFFFLGFLFLNNVVNAQEEIILFHSDTCPHCIEVLEFVDKHNLEEEINLKEIEASEEGFDEKYDKALEICDTGHQGGYPTLYYNGECFFGKTNNIEQLSEIAGITEVQGETEQTQEYQTPEETPPTETPEVEEEWMDDNQEEDVDQEQNPAEFQREPMPIWITITMFIGPAVFLYIIYLIIKKLNI